MRAASNVSPDHAFNWGANVGWIAFEQTYGQPKVNMLTGQLSGYVWSANCGWISLGNAVASMQTDSLFPGPLASDGLPIPWLLTYFGTTNIAANATPTFAIFVRGSGNVLFDPARNRIFVRFKDGGGVTRGATSVAVRTQ